MEILNFFRKKRAIHLDYASTTPVAPEVYRAMEPYWKQVWVNPSAIYASGVAARRAVEEARASVARMLHIRPAGVIFTSGGTESNNLALVGVIEAFRTRGVAYENMEVLTTALEHPSILETCAMLGARGVRTVTVPVGEDGRIDHQAFEELLSPLTVLVTTAYVNSEVGVVQDVKRLTRTVRAWNRDNHANVLVHLDGAQAPLWLPCEMDMLGIDMLSLDSGKCFGPKGAGVLAMRHGVPLAPVIHGGGQEGGLRPGTENVPLIVGCSAALLRAQATWKSRSEAVAALRDFMFEHLLKEVPGVLVNGSREHRVANNVNISMPGIDAEYAVITLDRYGVNASTKSACGAQSSQGSSVVRNMTGVEGRATSTIRFTLGPDTTEKELKTAVRVLKAHVAAVRSFRESLKGSNS